MTALDTVNRVFREFKRYTGDGLPSEPTGAALPIGDPQSGVHSPKKSEIREALLAPLEDLDDAVATAETAAAAALGAVPNTFSATRTALKALDTTTITAAYLKEAGREGQFIWAAGDYAARIASDPNESVYIKANGIAASAGAWVRSVAGPVYATWFGVVEGDSSTLAAGNDAPLLAARNFIASSDNPFTELRFSAGYYWHQDTFPNFAITNAVIMPDGEVHLRYDGTDNAVVLDGHATYDVGTGDITYEGARNVTWGPFIIDAKTTAQNGFVIRSVHFSEISPRVKGAGAAFAGIVVEWCVCTNFYAYCSGNGDGWYLGAAPTYGLMLDRTTTLGSNYVPPSYCNFYNIATELCVVGIYAIWSNGNIFYGGTSEGNASVGVSLDTNCQYTRFYGTDFEANGTYDIDVNGNYNEFHGVESLIHAVVEAAAKENKFIGGSYEKISVAATAFNLFSGVSFNRTGTGYLSDAVGQAAIVACYDTTLARRIDGTLANNPIVVGASPFTITNTNNNNLVIVISAGTITAVSYTPRGGAALDTAVTRLLTLKPGDATTVTYTVAPTIRSISA